MSYNHRTTFECGQIKCLHGQNGLTRKIARELRRVPSTVPFYVVIAQGHYPMHMM